MRLRLTDVACWPGGSGRAPRSSVRAFPDPERVAPGFYRLADTLEPVSLQIRPGLHSQNVVDFAVTIAGDVVLLSTAGADIWRHGQTQSIWVSAVGPDVGMWTFTTNEFRQVGMRIGLGEDPCAFRSPRSSRAPGVVPAAFHLHDMIAPKSSANKT